MGKNEMGKVFVLEKAAVYQEGPMDFNIYSAQAAAMDLSSLRGDHNWKPRETAVRCRLGYFADIDWYTPQDAGTPILIREDENGDKFRIVEIPLV
jgi:hypothetical protein